MALIGLCSGVGVRLKVGDKYWEEWRGCEGMCPPQLGSGGLPQKKISSALKVMQFWASFGTSFLQQKVGDYPPVLKVGDLSPCSPCSNAHAAVQNTTWDDGASYFAEILAAPGAKCSPVELLRSSAFCSSICIALNLSSRFFSRLYLALRFNLHRPIFTHYESSWIAYRLRFQPTTII